jgi:hypothetical protein
MSVPLYPSRVSGTMTRADLRDQLGNIDQIREILFGSQIRQYGDRVEQVEASLADLEQEMRDRTEGLKQSLSAQIHRQWRV